MKLEAFLQRLERFDPEVARRAIEVWDDRADAALWLATAHPGLGDVTPYRALVQDERPAVLDLLWGFEHGLPA